jgi:hypothetical protein
MVLALRLSKGPELDQGPTKDPVMVWVLGVAGGCPAQVSKYIHVYKISIKKYARKRQITWETWWDNSNMNLIKTKYEDVN